MSADSNRAKGDRDSAGRFLPGCRPGPGNPQVRRLALYQEAVHQACEPEALGRVLIKLRELAEAGDVGAAKVLLDRVLGRPRPAPEDGVAITLPALSDPAALVEAASCIVAAMAAGRLSPEQAARAAGVVELARRTVETRELAARIAKLEADTEGRS